MTPSDAPGGPPPPARRMMTAAGVVCSLLFIVAWLAPITYVGSAGHDVPGLDGDLRHLHRVACLFPNEVSWWGTYHVEIRADDEWVELPLDGYFDMSIFGYRTRFHRLFGKSYRRRGGLTRSLYLARWIARRRAERDPAAPPLTGMRFVAAYAPVSELRRETGRYRQPALADVPAPRRKVLFEIDGRRLYAPAPGLPE